MEEFRQGEFRLRDSHSWLIDYNPISIGNSYAEYPASRHAPVVA